MSAPPPLPEQVRMIEAILFASAEPMSERALAERLPEGCDVRAAVAELARHYEGRGVRLERIGGGHAFRTASDLAWLMSRERVELRRLSRPALETLAIIAYHQPASRAEIEEIRGVGVNRGTLGQLFDLGWIKLGRRREGPGRPVTYVTTSEFLDHFGLASAADLPGLAELRAAGLLDPAPAAADLTLPEETDDEPEPTDRHGDAHGDA